MRRSASALGAVQTFACRVREVTLSNFGQLFNLEYSRRGGSHLSDFLGGLKKWINRLASSWGTACAWVQLTGALRAVGLVEAGALA